MSSQPSNEASGMTTFGQKTSLALFMSVYLVGMLHRSIITVLLQPIKLEFDLTDTQLGFISGLAFSLAYAAAAVPMGMLADRISRRMTLALLVLLWSSLTSASGLISGFGLLCLARIGVGLAEAGQPPIVMSLVGDIFAPQRRATAVSLIYLGVPLGALVGFMLAAKLAAAYGWRTAMIGAGLPGIVLAILIPLLLQEPARGRLDAPTEIDLDKPGFGECIRYLLNNKPLLHTLVGAGLASIVSSAVSVWLPSLMMRQFNQPIGTVGPVIAVSMGGFGIVGGLLGGSMVDRFCRGSLARMAGVTAGMIAALLPISIFCFTASNMYVSAFCNGLFNLLVPGYLASLHALVIGLTIPSARGFMISLLAIMFTLVGYGLGSQAVGMLSDFFKAQGFSSPLMAALLVSTATLAWAAFHLLLARRHILRAAERASGTTALS